MGEITQPAPVLLILAAFSRHIDALDWGLAKASPRFSFVETAYYEPTMGPDIQKCFWAFERLIDPAALVELKLQTNAWEAEYAGRGGHSEPRPLNLDPGYLTPAKL